MKRLTALLMAAVLLLSACGSKENSPKDEQEQNKSSITASPMTIVRTKFTQETEEILNMLDTDGIGFFDFAVDDTVSAFTVNVWVLIEGKWVSSGEIHGNVENKQGRIGIQLLEDGCNMFQLKDTGHTKYSVKYSTGLKDCTTVGKRVQEDTATIQIGQEQVLLLNMGWKRDWVEANEMAENFRSSGCDAGVVVTIVFTAPAA